MRARKVKARVLRVIDGIDPWEDLNVEVTRLETIARSSVAGDASPPLVTTSSTDDDKTKYLDAAAQRIRDALEAAQKLDAKGKQYASEQALRAVEKAKELAHTLAMPQASAAAWVSRKLEKAEEAAKSLVPWYIGIGVVTWIVVGVAAYMLWEYNEKDRPRREATAAKFAGHS